jgi:hypothetical protein
MGSKGPDSSRAVGGQLRKACVEKSLKESEELNSGGIVPCEYFGNRPRKGSNRKNLWNREISKEENRQLGFAEESRETPLIVRSQVKLRGI